MSTINSAEIEEFEQKVDEVHSKLQDLLNGKICDDVFAGEMNEYDAQILSQKQLENENKLWWEAAKIFVEANDSKQSESIPSDDQLKRRVRRAYTYDNYAKWDTWKPSDPATQEEDKETQARAQAEFERMNPEFCEQINQDIKRRSDNEKKNQQEADKCRITGNNLYNQKNYTEARIHFSRALKLFPFDVRITTNIAQVHIQQQQWKDALEFISRTLYIDPCHLKALSRKAHVLKSLQRYDEALKATITGLNICDKQSVRLEDSQRKELQSQHYECSHLAREHNIDITVSGWCNYNALKICKQPLEVQYFHANRQLLFTWLDSVSESLTSTTNAALDDSTLTEMKVRLESVSQLTQQLTPQLQSSEELRACLRINQLMELRLLPAVCRSVDFARNTLAEATPNKILSTSSKHIAANWISLATQCYSVLAAILPNEHTLKQFAANAKVLDVAYELISCVNNYLSGHEVTQSEIDDSVEDQKALVELISLMAIMWKSCICTSDTSCPSLRHQAERYCRSHSEAQMSVGAMLLMISAKLQLYGSEDNFTRTLRSVIVNVVTFVNETLDLHPLCELVPAVSSFISARWCLFQPDALTATECIWGGSETDPSSVSVSSIVCEFALAVFHRASLTDEGRLLLTSRNTCTFSLKADTDTAISAVGVILKMIDKLPNNSINALAVLMNATHGSSEAAEVARRSVVSVGYLDKALSAIFEFCVESGRSADNIVKGIETMTVLGRKVGLLSKLIGQSEVQYKLSRLENYSQLCYILKDCATSGIADDSTQECKFSLVTILAAVSKLAAIETQAVGVICSLLQSLLSLFPVPHQDLGEVTAKSVSLIPRQVAQPLLLGNAACCLLVYADCAEYRGQIFTTGAPEWGTEKLICALATCTDIRVRKNLSALIARGCRDPAVRQRVTDLRGLEMMREINT